MSDNSKLILVGVVLLGFLLFKLPERIAPNRPVPTPTTSSIDLRSVFATNADAATRRAHAGDARAIFRIAADGVEWDGRQTAEERSFVDSRQVDQHIVIVRRFFSHEWKFRDAYPQLGQVIADHLKARLGERINGPLTDDVRTEWVKALRDVEAACFQAQGG